MWSPFRAAREREQREHAARLAALDAIKEVALKQSEAVIEMAKVQREYLDHFRVGEIPQAQVMTDKDEWLAEQMKIFGLQAPEESEPLSGFVLRDMD